MPFWLFLIFVAAFFAGVVLMCLGRAKFAITPVFLGLVMIVLTGMAVVIGAFTSWFGLVEQPVPAEKTVTIYNDDGTVLVQYEGNVSVSAKDSRVVIEVDGETYEYSGNPVYITYNTEKE